MCSHEQLRAAPSGAEQLRVASEPAATSITNLLPNDFNHMWVVAFISLQSRAFPSSYEHFRAVPSSVSKQGV